MSDIKSLIQQFVAAAEESGATVERLPRSPESLKEAIQRILSTGDEVPSAVLRRSSGQGSGQALLAEPDDLPAELWDPLRDLEQVIDHPTDDQLRSL
ncbi:unnamed protein product, partial [marine sediment metagenome]